MSDYGFATYDEKTGKVAEKINSKYPIFGPEYKNIDKQFLTVRIVETVHRSPDDVDGGEPLPGWQSPYYMDGTWYGTSRAQKTIDEVVYRYKHNLGKRPLGYYTVTGNIVRNTRVRLQQTIAAGSGYGGPFLSYRNIMKTAVLRPTPNMMNEMSFSSYGFWENNQVQPYNSSSYSGYGNFPIPNDCLPAFADFPNGTNLYTGDEYGVAADPYYVEITDEEVIVHHKYHWADKITKVGYPDDTLIVYQRTRAIEDFSGSTIDITIYLVPYSEGDLG